MSYPPENNIPAPPGPKIPNEQISTRGMVEICSFGIFGPGKWEEREYYFLEGMTFPAETVIGFYSQNGF